MCPHTTIYVSSYHYICVRILLMCVSSYYFASTHPSPHAIYSMRVRRRSLWRQKHQLVRELYICVHTTICVLILLHMRYAGDLSGGNAYFICVSSYYYICVLILLTTYLFAYYYMCPHTSTYAVRRRPLWRHHLLYICVLALLCMCPHPSTYAGDPSGGTANLCGNTVQAIVRYEKKDGQVRSLLALLVQKYEY